ncbi:reverse transcriptase, partial [Verticillium dahliae]
MEDLETINPFTLPPWMERVQTVTEWNDEDATLTRVDEEATVRIAVSSSARNEVVGVGGTVKGPGTRLETFSFTHGMRTDQNPFSGELVAAAYALRFLPQLRGQTVTLLTSNKAAVLTLRNPQQQSGQEYVRCIYEAITRLRETGNTISVVWLPSHLDDDLLKKAKGEARKASRDGALPEKQFPKMRSTTLNAARRKLRVERRLPDNVGKLSKEVDIALPGKHTRELYDNLSWMEASMLA